jgi:hypothetical protein
MQIYCVIVKNHSIESKGDGASARVSVNFREFSPCMARAALTRGFDSSTSNARLRIPNTRQVLHFCMHVELYFRG